MSELSLVFFTVLAQSAVGLFITLGLVELLARPNTKAMNHMFLAVFVLLGLGAFASITHLGQPFRMMNVAFGLAHLSPLSLEIVALSLFSGASFTYVVMRWFNILPERQTLVLVPAMMLGIVLILAVTHVYTLDTVPTWNSIWTAYQFLMTAFLVGPVAAIGLLRWKKKEVGEQYTRTITNGLAVASLIIMTLLLIGYVGYLFWLGQLDVQGNPLAMVGYGQTVAMVRIFLIMSSVLTLAVSTIRGNKGLPLAAGCFVFVLLAELAGRAFFYDIHLSAGSGM